MSDLHVPAPPQPGPSARDLPNRPVPNKRAFRFWLLLVRLSSVIDALFLLAQPVWIGQYLAGVYGWLGIHSAGGIFAAMTGVVLFFAGLGYALSGGRWLVPLVALVLVVAEIVQAHEGFVRNLAVHIPLGVFVIVAGVTLAVASFTRVLSQPRPRRRDVPVSVARPPVGSPR